MPATDDRRAHPTPASYPVDGPANHIAAVTPNDSTDLAYVTTGLFVGGAGNIKVTTSGGDTGTFTGVAAGSILPVRVTRVWATGTTATNIVALW